MSYRFTEFVRNLGATPEIVDAAGFQTVWQALRGVLRAELGRRGLWDSSPSYLGIDGWSRWQVRELGPVDGGLPPGPRDALDELTAACYAYVFVHRLRGLRAQLKLKPNVDGLVFRSIRNFLYDTQKREDPLGFRIYSIFERALRLAVETGGLHLLSGGPRIANPTVFGFNPFAEPCPAPPVDLDETVRPWSDRLLPGLVTAVGADEERLVVRLADLVLELPGDGVEAFAFKDLIDPIKSQVRARWAALWEQTAGDTAFEDSGAEMIRLVRLSRPDTGFEDRQHFEYLADCVERVLSRQPGRRKTRDYLLALWRFLRRFSLAAAAPLSASGSPAIAAADVERLPSYRQLARLLDIPRGRLPGLFAILRDVLEGCRRDVEQANAASSPDPEVSPSGRYAVERLTR